MDAESAVHSGLGASHAEETQEQAANPPGQSCIVF